jgi:hypothetical protein
MIVEAAGFAQALDGTYQALPPGEDTSPRSAREFITGIDKPSFILNPGPSGAQQVTARIKVPQNITAGGYYAIIYVHSQPAGEGQVGIVLAANIPVVLNVGSAGQTTTGEIVDVTTGKVQAGKPIEVATVFKNTGNYHYKARNRVTISDGAGNQVAEASVPLTAASIIPGYGYRFAASLLIAGGLDAGDYRLSSEVIGEDGAIKDTHEITLEIGESVKKDPKSKPIIPIRMDNSQEVLYPLSSTSNFNTHSYNTHNHNSDYKDMPSPALPTNIFRLLAIWLETLSN